MQASRTSWHLLYGGILAAVIAGSVLAAATNVHSLSEDIIKSVQLVFLQTLPILFGLIAFFSVLECVLPAAGPRKPLKGYILNCKLTVLDALTGALFGSAVGACVTLLSNRLSFGWIDLRFSTSHGIMDTAYAFLLSSFILDFFFYWAHRFQHESALWHQHRVHHLDEELCAFSTSRHNWLEGLATGPLVTIPAAILFKMNAAQGAITGAMFVAWVAFVHSNIRLHLGPLGVLFNGPQGHRIHHSRMREHHDKNYAAFFPIWDVLFGTYHYPKRDEYPPTGVDGEKEVGSFFEAATLPFREWRKMFREWKVRHGSVLP